MQGLSAFLSLISGSYNPTVSIIQTFVVLVAVPVRATTGTNGNKFAKTPIFLYAGLKEDLKPKKKVTIMPLTFY